MKRAASLAQQLGVAPRYVANVTSDSVNVSALARRERFRVIPSPSSYGAADRADRFEPTFRAQLAELSVHAQVLTTAGSDELMAELERGCDEEQARARIEASRVHFEEMTRPKGYARGRIAR